MRKLEKIGSSSKYNLFGLNYFKSKYIWKNKNNKISQYYNKPIIFGRIKKHSQLNKRVSQFFTSSILHRVNTRKYNDINKHVSHTSEINKNNNRIKLLKKQSRKQYQADAKTDFLELTEFEKSTL